MVVNGNELLFIIELRNDIFKHWVGRIPNGLDTSSDNLLGFECMRSKKLLFIKTLFVF